MSALAHTSVSGGGDANSSLETFIRSAARAAHMGMLLDDRCQEPIVVKLKPGLPTACWTPGGLVGHMVFIGTGCLDKARPELTGEQKARYVGKFLHHERAHALYTERDRCKIERWLEATGVPFDLYNLVEDARVEHRYVAEATDGFAFGWTEFEAIEASSLRKPAALRQPWDVVLCAFFNLVQTGGNEPSVRALYTSAEAMALDEAIGYYHQAIATRDSHEAILVAAAMIERYGAVEAPKTRCGLQLGMSMQGSEGAAALAAFLESAQSTLEGATVRPPPQPSMPGTGQEQSWSKGADLLAPQAVHPLDEARIHRLMERLARLAGRTHVERDATSTPATRVSLRHALQHRAKWIGPEQASRPQRARKVLLVVDVSGSMRGSPLLAAAYLVAALSELCRRRMVSGHVVLSTTSQDEIGSLWECRPLPWTVQEAARIQTHNLEGLAETLHTHDSLLSEADVALVHTDGSISGRPIPHAAYRKRGITVIGTYVNDGGEGLEQTIEGMLNHFERVIVRDSVERLVEALMNLRLD